VVHAKSAVADSAPKVPISSKPEIGGPPCGSEEDADFSDLVSAVVVVLRGAVDVEGLLARRRGRRAGTRVHRGRQRAGGGSDDKRGDDGLAEHDQVLRCCAALVLHQPLGDAILRKPRRTNVMQLTSSNLLCPGGRYIKSIGSNGRNENVVMAVNDSLAPIGLDHAKSARRMN
jgi:hypothetical protein